MALSWKKIIPAFTANKLTRTDDFFFEVFRSFFFSITRPYRKKKNTTVFVYTSYIFHRRCCSESPVPLLQIVYSVLCQQQNAPDTAAHLEGRPVLDVAKWQDVCDLYLGTDAVQFVRGEAKRVLLALCGSSAAYHSLRDNYRYTREFGKVTGLVAELQSNAGSPNTASSINMTFAAITRVATQRPANWWAFCQSRGAAVVQFLLDYVQRHMNDSVVYPIRLLCIYLTHAKKVRPPSPPPPPRPPPGL